MSALSPKRQGCPHISGCVAPPCSTCQLCITLLGSRAAIEINSRRIDSRAFSRALAQATSEADSSGPGPRTRAQVPDPPPEGPHERWPPRSTPNIHRSDNSPRFALQGSRCGYRASRPYPGSCLPPAVVCTAESRWRPDSRGGLEWQGRLQRTWRDVPRAMPSRRFCRWISCQAWVCVEGRCMAASECRSSDGALTEASDELSRIELSRILGGSSHWLLWGKERSVADVKGNVGLV